jgi:hypothetical protein
LSPALSQDDPLNLVERELIPPTVIEASVLNKDVLDFHRKCSADGVRDHNPLWLRPRRRAHDLPAAPLGNVAR